MQEEIVVGSKGHVRRVDLCHAVDQLVLKALVAERRQVTIIHLRIILDKIVCRLARRIQDQHFTAKALVVLQRTTQESRPFMTDNDQRKTLFQRCAFLCNVFNVHITFLLGLEACAL